MTRALLLPGGQVKVEQCRKGRPGSGFGGIPPDQRNGRPRPARRNPRPRVAKDEPMSELPTFEDMRRAGLLAPRARRGRTAFRLEARDRAHHGTGTGRA